ncbi:hypothetical protein GQ457_02G006150 [Hibiscus cannabinus]
MRAASKSTAAVFRHWNSPIPYLFGGIAAMPLHYLFSHGEEDEKPAKQLQMEPKFVVIMAGDENPTYIANPIRPIFSNTNKITAKEYKRRSKMRMDLVERRDGSKIIVKFPVKFTQIGLIYFVARLLGVGVVKFLQLKSKLLTFAAIWTATI